MRTKRVVLWGLLVVLALQILLYALTLASLPPVPQVTADMPPSELRAATAGVDRDYLPQVHLLADTFSGWQLSSLPDRRRDLLEPQGYALEKRTHPERVDRYNETLRKLHRGITGTLVLLGCVHLAALAALAWMLRRRLSWRAVLAVLLPCLAITPPVTEAVLGRDLGLGLWPFIAVQLAGGIVLGVMRARSREEAQAGDLKWLGWLFDHPGCCSLLMTVIFSALGAGCIALGAEENLDFLVTIGATFLANALVLLGVTGWQAGLWVLERGRRTRPRK